MNFSGCIFHLEMEPIPAAISLQVQDMINEIDVDGSGFLEFPEFCLMLYKKTQDADIENDLKETFRVFSKDDEGCITAEELKFVLTHLPGKVTNLT